MVLTTSQMEKLSHAAVLNTVPKPALVAGLCDIDGITNYSSLVFGVQQQPTTAKLKMPMSLLHHQQRRLETES